MPPAKWTTMEQYQWLQEQLLEYATLRNSEAKDYTVFWPKINLHWFSTWPERAILFPDIPIDVMLTEEQKATEIAAEDSHKVVSHQMHQHFLTTEAKPCQQLQTWFHWRTNASKKNHGLKKDTSIFKAALVPKLRSKSAEEIYMDMVYDKRIRPLIKAEEEAGNISTAGRCMALGQKFCKELLEDKSDEVKKEVKDKYDKQKKVKRDMLDDEDDNYETDPDAIAK